jgi:8-oxo-dGTP diphosphatase
VIHPVFCPACGSRKLLRQPAEDAYCCRDCNAVQYLNSKPAVCAIIIRDGSVLLVQGHDSTRGWDLPGGFLRLGENPEDGLKRELHEELTAHVAVVQLLHAKVEPYGSHGEFSLNLFYEATLLSEVLVPANEVARFAWFSLSQLPALEYRGTAWALEDFARRPSVPSQGFPSQH